MEPLLRTLTRDDDSKRTRHIKPGERVQSLWENLTDESTKFVLFSHDGEKFTSHSDSNTRGASGSTESPYLFYNEANVAEDKVLFPDELIHNKENVFFREITNGVKRMESGLLPSFARRIAKDLEDLNTMGDPKTVIHDAMKDDDGKVWVLPKVWKSAINQVRKAKSSNERMRLLERTGLDGSPECLSFEQRGDEADPVEIMERDRSSQFKQSFHDGDLEPGSTQKYMETQDMIEKLLDCDHSGPVDWVWFIAELIDWLQLRADYDDYAMDPSAPWPRSFIIHDMVRSFITMAMFFPDIDFTAFVTNFLKSTPCESFRNSALFDPKQRVMTRPDRRGRTSNMYRRSEFWAKSKSLMTTEKHYADVYPLDWSLAIRPMVAQLYKSGIIAPAYYQADLRVVGGLATANTEPERPDKLDLFINYEDDYGNFPQKFPPSFAGPDKWPELLPRAQEYALKNPSARFALMRLWSAPHFYPLMVGLQNRQGCSFLDSAARVWQWNFVPKDMPGSEFSMHNVIKTRLELLREQFEPGVVSRGDLILAMGENVEELFKICTVVTFAMQTKPWLREVDLWKSFINVDLDFLIDLDEYWLD
ncbi:hypothetical protein QQS21_000440 [Conoideocrella luteorostrata]|uniref:Uncharacterized protein n=1 Tax=Conoideocrella luteorostrata TaxID=1105319 RepID=A0AAJ0D119_9HYPO|nr:hypothetical protein QQS21_000440 [Conoideocrella luteorostrata]